MVLLVCCLLGVGGGLVNTLESIRPRTCVDIKLRNYKKMLCNFSIVMFCMDPDFSSAGPLTLHTHK